jgi:aryl-alcohol dehydrogenase-like predicted oxidoreductase
MTLPIGLGSSYGIGADEVEAAVERGVNWLYWGSLRRPSFGEGITRATRRDRESVIVVVQSYSRVAALMPWSVERALRTLKLDHADVLLLGMWNEPVPERILDMARTLKERGRVRRVIVSCHRRTTFVHHLAEPLFDAVMVRYNAAHPGAEEDVFPHLPARRVGVIAYTATSWGRLLDPARVPEGMPTPRASDCYRFALTNPAVDMVLAGPRDRAELDEALSALDRGPMDPDEIAWMKRVGAAVK